MFCGWASMVYAMRGDFGTAAPLIGFAMVLDMLDGRIALVTTASQPLGSLVIQVAGGQGGSGHDANAQNGGSGTLFVSP